jgi:roadblock/LC7 domain-containing protein
MTRLTATKQRGARRLTAESDRKKIPAAPMLPIPTGGLDAVSPLTKMPPENAVVLDNWFPQLRYIELRRGHQVQCNTGEGVKSIETLMAYNAEAGSSDKLFAALNGKIVDVSTSVVAAGISGLTNNRWQHINFATSAGQFLVMVNGADGVRTYNGAAWATQAITGVTAADLIHIASFKNRIWFVEKNSLDAWFLPPDSIAGAASKFPLGGTLKKGGALMAIGTWSLDGGDGPDDRIAFLSTKGELAIYGGTDPTNASTWSLQGVYEIGAPIGRRCLLKIGGDLAAVCIDGIVPISKAMVLERGSQASVAISAYIQPLLNSDARNFKGLFGWQLISYPLGTRAIFNVPQLENETSIQYVMNTISGAWCRFTGMNANCWELFQERIFFGGNDGKVYEADKGADDNGQPIVADLQTAFNDLGSPLLKLFCLARPFIVTDGDVAPGLALNVDYRNDAQVDFTPADIPAAAEWDVAEWDVAEWPIEENLVADWVEVAALEGNTVSIRMGVSAAGTGGGGDVVLRLIALQIAFFPGGIL